MKKKTSPTKGSNIKGATVAPTIKKLKSSKKLKLPKGTNIDENVVKKTKFAAGHPKIVKNNEIQTTTISKSSVGLSKHYQASNKKAPNGPLARNKNSSNGSKKFKAETKAALKSLTETHVAAETMKKKTSPTKGSNIKGATVAPTIKKVKSSKKLKLLPKGTSIDENVVKKTKFAAGHPKIVKNNEIQATTISKSSVGLSKHYQASNKKAPNGPLAISKNSSNGSKKFKAETKAALKSLTETHPEIQTVRQKSSKLLPTTCVSEALVVKAVKALSQLAQQQKKKNQMFEDEASVFAQIMCMKIQNHRGSVRFSLPHSTVASTGEVCLVTPDLKKGRKPDHEPSVDHWEEVLRKAGVTQVKTVLPMRQLRVEYDQYELKRRLLTQHDFILVDSRVLNHVSHLLGKAFFKKHNMLVPVRLQNVKDIKKNIENALKTAILRLSEGPTSTILVGHMGMSPKSIKENILALVRQLPEKYPGGEHNVKSLSIKLPLSLALPVYVTLRSKKTVMAPRLHTELPKQHQVVEGELSTVLGGRVKVTPEGAVLLHKNSDEDFSDMDMEDEDEEIVKLTSKIKKNTKASKKQTGKRNSDVSEYDSEPENGSVNVSENEASEDNDSDQENSDPASEHESDSE